MGAQMVALHATPGIAKRFQQQTLYDGRLEDRAWQYKQSS